MEEKENGKLGFLCVSVCVCQREREKRRNRLCWFWCLWREEVGSELLGQLRGVNFFLYVCMYIDYRDREKVLSLSLSFFLSFSLYKVSVCLKPCFGAGQCCFSSESFLSLWHESWNDIFALQEFDQVQCKNKSWFYVIIRFIDTNFFGMTLTPNRFRVIFSADSQHDNL